VRAERVPVRILRLQTTAAQYRNMASFASVGQAARGAIIEVWYYQIALWECVEKRMSIGKYTALQAPGLSVTPRTSEERNCAHNTKVKIRIYWVSNQTSKNTKLNVKPDADITKHPSPPHHTAPEVP
jgi:hypothetical protein